jgi:hypothetical protein
MATTSSGGVPRDLLHCALLGGCGALVSLLVALAERVGVPWPLGVPGARVLFRV